MAAQPSRALLVLTIVSVAAIAVDFSVANAATITNADGHGSGGAHRRKSSRDYPSAYGARARSRSR